MALDRRQEKPVCEPLFWVKHCASCHLMVQNDVSLGEVRNRALMGTASSMIYMENSWEEALARLNRDVRLFAIVSLEIKYSVGSKWSCVPAACFLCGWEVPLELSLFRNPGIKSVRFWQSTLTRKKGVFNSTLLCVCLPLSLFFISPLLWV